jgi:hypothetical protein
MEGFVDVDASFSSVVLDDFANLSQLLAELPDDMMDFTEEDAPVLHIPEPQQDYQQILDEFLIPGVPNVEIKIGSVKIVFKDHRQVELSGGERPKKIDINNWTSVEFIKVLSALLSEEVESQRLIFNAMEDYDRVKEPYRQFFSSSLAGKYWRIGRNFYQLDRRPDLSNLKGQAVQHLRLLKYEVELFRGYSVREMVGIMSRKERFGKPGENKNSLSLAYHGVEGLCILQHCRRRFMMSCLDKSPRY